MRALLDPLSDVSSEDPTLTEVYDHISYQEVVKLYPEVASFKKFVVMRDPYERARSLFYHHMKYIDGPFKKIHENFPITSRTLYLLVKGAKKGKLSASVSYYTSGATFQVFSIQDPLLVSRVEEFLGTPTQGLTHLNAIAQGAGQTLTALERLIVRIFYSDDLALYEKVLNNGSVTLDV